MEESSNTDPARKKNYTLTLSMEQIRLIELSLELKRQDIENLVNKFRSNGISVEGSSIHQVNFLIKRLITEIQAQVRAME